MKINLFLDREERAKSFTGPDWSSCFPGASTMTKIVRAVIPHFLRVCLPAVRSQNEHIIIIPICLNTDGSDGDG